jgi:hypothetical protein
MVYHDQIEQYKREVEHRAKQILSQNFDKVNQVLQVKYIWNVL